MQRVIASREAVLDARGLHRQALHFFIYLTRYFVPDLRANSHSFSDSVD